MHLNKPALSSSPSSLRQPDDSPVDITYTAEEVQRLTGGHRIGGLGPADECQRDRSKREGCQRMTARQGPPPEIRRGRVGQVLRRSEPLFQDTEFRDFRAHRILLHEIVSVIR